MSIFSVAMIPLKCTGAEVDLCAVKPSSCDLHISERGHTCEPVWCLDTQGRYIYMMQVNSNPASPPHFVDDAADYA